MKLRRKPRVVDALSPLDAITGGLLNVMLFLVVVGTLLVGFGGGTWSDINADEICTSSNFHGGSDPDPELEELVRDSQGLTPGTRVEKSDSEVCQSDPHLGQRVLQALKTQPTLVVFVGFLFLTQRTIRHARRFGLFSRALALKIERLGWLLVLGLVVSAVVEWLADGFLRSTMWDSGWASGSFGISVAGLIGGYGIVSIGRVMSRAADLQEDVEGTV